MSNMLLAKIFGNRFFYGLSPLYAQTSWPWGGLAVGDAVLAPYSADEWSDIWRKLFQRDRTLEGVLPDYLNELTVTNPAGVTIRTASGGALVDGTYFDNTANVDIVVVAPGGGSNFYRIVLHKSWAAQDVRISLLGPNVVAPDAVTQVDGVTWEISLATVEITSGSVVTVTDDRTYLHFNTQVATAMIEAEAITNAQMADDSVDSDQYVDGSVDAVHLNDGAGSGVDADLLDGEEGAYYEGTLINYSAISTIIGWSGYTQKLIEYRKSGNMLFVNISISGTSDAVNTSITLPYDNGNTSPIRCYVRARDNGVWQTAGLMTLAAGANLCVFHPSSAGAAGWIAANTKAIECQFFILEAA